MIGVGHKHSGSRRPVYVFQEFPGQDSPVSLQSIHNHPSAVTLKSTHAVRPPSSILSYVLIAIWTNPSNAPQGPKPYLHLLADAESQSLPPPVQPLEAVPGLTITPFSHPQWWPWSVALKPSLTHFFMHSAG